MPVLWSGLLRTRRCHLGGSFPQANSFSVSGNSMATEEIPGVSLRAVLCSGFIPHLRTVSGLSTNAHLQREWYPLPYTSWTWHRASVAAWHGDENFFLFHLLFTSLNLFISPHVIHVTIKGNLPVLLNFFLHTMDSDLNFPFQLFLDFPHPLRDTPFCRSL